MHLPICQKIQERHIQSKGLEDRYIHNYNTECAKGEITLQEFKEKKKKKHTKKFNEKSES